jgi:hypothetical protein
VPLNPPFPKVKRMYMYHLNVQRPTPTRDAVPRLAVSRHILLRAEQRSIKANTPKLRPRASKLLARRKRSRHPPVSSLLLARRTATVTPPRPARRARRGTCISNPNVAIKTLCRLALVHRPPRHAGRPPPARQRREFRPECATRISAPAPAAMNSVGRTFLCPVGVLNPQHSSGDRYVVPVYIASAYLARTTAVWWCRCR